MLNKSDIGTESIKKFLSEFNPIVMSLKNNVNIDILISAIKTSLSKQLIKSENVLITRSRHREHLKECLKHIKIFLDKKDNVEFEKAAEDLRLAIRHLGTIVGRVDVEEILGSIFDNFCIGK